MILNIKSLSCFCLNLAGFIECLTFLQLCSLASRKSQFFHKTYFVVKWSEQKFNQHDDIRFIAKINNRKYRCKLISHISEYFKLSEAFPVEITSSDEKEMETVQLVP